MTVISIESEWVIFFLLEVDRFRLTSSSNIKCITYMEFRQKLGKVIMDLLARQTPQANQAFSEIDHECKSERFR